MRIFQWRCLSLVKCLLLFTVVFIIASIAYKIVQEIYDQKCSNTTSKRILNSVCHLWESKKIDGNLCKDLCERHAIKYQKCLNNATRKQVFLATWNLQTLVLKSERPYFKDYEPVITKTTAVDSLRVENIAKISRNILMERMGIKFSEPFNHKIFLQALWPVPFKNHTPSLQGDKNLKFVNSFNTLVSQNEYVFMKLHHKLQVFPKMYGTCGHFYAHEYAPHIGEDKIHSLSAVSKWNGQRELAIKFMDFIKQLDRNFPQPVHICDMKHDKFGVSENGHLHIIDTNMMFFDKKFKILLSNKKCGKHTDCDILECKGWCNLKNHQCKERRINNNIQVLCSEILSPQIRGAFKGLLQDPPQAFKLRFDRILDECRNPWNIQHNKIRLKTPDATYMKLYKLLQQSIGDVVNNNIPPRVK